MVYHRLMKIWNQDHFDHYRPYISEDGERGFAIVKCEKEITNGRTENYSDTGHDHHAHQAVVQQGGGRMNGYVPELTRLEKLQNEKVAVKDILLDDPKNQYWLDRLSAVEAELEAERGRELFRPNAEDVDPTGKGWFNWDDIKEVPF